MVFSLMGCASSRTSQMQYAPSAHIIKNGKRYIVKGTVDLKGETLVLPKSIILDCEDGVLKNGYVKGSGNRIVYKKPFLDENINIEGCYVTDKTLYSNEILVKNGFSNEDIHNVYNIVCTGSTVVFEKGVYKGITPIDITKNITLDFSNSIIETAIDRYELSCPVF